MNKLLKTWYLVILLVIVFGNGIHDRIVSARIDRIENRADRLMDSISENFVMHCRHTHEPIIGGEVRR